MSRLSPEQIQYNLGNIPGWKLKDMDAIERVFDFSNFDEAMHFVNEVAGLARDMNHHPLITINYNKVSLTLRTWDVQGMTGKDFAFAQRLNKMLGNNKKKRLGH
ncbi:4a-hydroxytetrahydrobiopterin dehydratase [Microaerobacter geothermalis]|uniref:4a-hydroxytetrahydrobiopterin dehydratase n=1 Tax=Microaerobacter geothermalis TaxID=674972 RepID=UPI001F2743DF|nr:4a-hydroxytetrahydrobiopterin dehydratase [Microaerobacter geothermalis]MCF6094128.1 4a-hydroxytetrahydrobiopterin dehydratase [Microaerobacter geothermalis]